MKGFILLLVALVCGQDAEDGQRFRMDMTITPSNQVQPGNTVTLTCTVQALTEDADHILQWKHEVGGEKYQVGTNKYVDPGVTSHGRYAASADTEDMKKFVYKFTITDVQKTDSGKWGCEIPDTQVIFFKDLIVPVQPNSVVLSSGGRGDSSYKEYNDGDMVEFHEGETHSFTCVISGGYPQPTPKVTIGTEDLTSQFEQNEPVLKTEGTSALDARPYYELALTHDQMAIAHTFHDRSLTCEGSTPGALGEPVKTSIKITLPAFKPQFNCPRTHFYKPYERFVNITCMIKAKPPVEDSYMFYYRANGFNVTLEPNGERKYHYRLLTVPDRNNSEVVNMIISVDRLFPNHFREYHLVASNDRGTTEYVIELKTPASYTFDSSSPISATMLLVMLSSIICLLTTIL